MSARSPLPLYPLSPRASVEYETPRAPTPECRRCALHKETRAVCARSDGKQFTGPGGVLVVASAPTKAEDYGGAPAFGSEGGRYLRKLIAEAGVTNVVYGYAVRCARPNGEVLAKDKLGQDAIGPCRTYLTEDMRFTRPSRIIAVGDAAIESLLGDDAPRARTCRRAVGWLSQAILPQPTPVLCLPDALLALRHRTWRATFEADVKWALTTTPVRPPWRGSYEIIDSAADSLAAVEEIRRRFAARDGSDPYACLAFDVETSGLLWTPEHRVLCLGAALSSDGVTASQGWLWTEAALYDEKTRAPLFELLQDPAVPKGGANVKYDLNSMRTAFGIEVAPVVFDTRLVSRLIEPDNDADLDNLGWQVGCGGHKSEAAKHVEKAVKAVKKAEKIVANTPAGQGSLFDTAPVVPPVGAGAKTVAYALLPKDVLYRYCLTGESVVHLADGSRVPLKTLVRNKHPGPVLSLREDGVVEAKPITAWHRMRVENQPWVRARLSGATAGQRGLTTTPEHMVYTARGPVRADALVVGDEVLTEERRFTPEAMQALVGTLLGDTSLAVAPSYRKNPHSAPSAYLSGGHTVASGLSAAKESALGGFLRLGPTLPARSTTISGRKAECAEYQPFTSRSTAQLAPLLAEVRDGPKRRRLHTRTLDRLGAIGLAWWFMDDGCHQTPSGGNRDGAVLGTYRYPAADVRATVAWFRARYGSTQVYAGKDRVVRFFGAAAAAFRAEIAPHVLPCARYKLGPGQWPAYVPFKVHEGLVTRSVIEVGPHVPPRNTKSERFNADTRWCLTVADNHNFFTSNGLVANCSRDSITTARGAAHLSASMRTTANAGPRWIYDDIIKRATGTFARIESRGFPIDKEALFSVADSFGGQIEAARDAIRRECPNLNPDSPEQIADLLYREAGLKTDRKTKGGAESTDRATLEELEGQHPVIPHLLVYNDLTHLRRTYVDGMPENGAQYGTGGMFRHLRRHHDGTWRVHTSYNLDGARCMPAGELVLTSRGYLPVERVRGGDLVISHTGVARRVEELSKHAPVPIVRVTLDNGLVLRTTANHAYFTGDAWIEAGNLTPGQPVRVHSAPERWAVIEDWGDFSVSTWGRVRNDKTGNAVTQRPKGRWGHVKVCLYRNGAQHRGEDRRDFAVHRLVMLAFGGPPGEGQEVRHLNGLAWDNTIENLAWGSSLENKADARKHGTMSLRRREDATKLTEADVAAIRAARRPVHGGAGRWDKTGAVSDATLAATYGVVRETIRDIRSGKRWLPEDHIEGQAVAFSTAHVASVVVEAPAVTYGLSVAVDHSHVTGGIVTHNTGRLSSSDPNLQNIPKAETLNGKLLKDLFIAPRGWKWLQLDYSQLELRVAAIVANDPIMAEIFASGIDYHLRTAELIAPIAFGVSPAQWAAMTDKERKPFRSKAKSVNFGLLYGMGVKTLALRMGCDEATADKTVKAILGKLVRLHAWLNKSRRDTEDTGVIWTDWKNKPGRRRPVHFMEYTGTVSVNTPIQGKASDYCLSSVVDIEAHIAEDGLAQHAELVGTIHDSILFLVREAYLPEVAHIAADVMQGHGRGEIVRLDVDAEYGDRLGSLEKFKFAA